MGERESELVQACLDSTFVSSVGEHVNQFEDSLADFTGARHAIAVVNGTAALSVALSLAGVERDTEVIVPALSFVGTANAVAHLGAVPHFVDSEQTSLGMAPEPLSEHLAKVTTHSDGQVINRLTGRRISAIVPMHTYGHPVDMAPLMEVANSYGLPVVEDAAESLGSTYHDQHTGTFGLLGILSFNGNKIITTGGGGAILTDDDQLAKRAKHLTTTAKQLHRWDFVHDEVAWNYRLPNLNAALGCAQMERLPKFIERKRLLAQQYQDAFASSKSFVFVDEPPDTRSNYWLSTVRLLTAQNGAREHVLEATNDAGFQCRPAWQLLHTLPMYTDSPRANLEAAELLASSLINLPSSPHLAGETV